MESARPADASSAAPESGSLERAGGDAGERPGTSGRCACCCQTTATIATAAALNAGERAGGVRGQAARRTHFAANTQLPPDEPRAPGRRFRGVPTLAGGCNAACGGTLRRHGVKVVRVVLLLLLLLGGDVRHDLYADASEPCLVGVFLQNRGGLLVLEACGGYLDGLVLVFKRWGTRKDVRCMDGGENGWRKGAARTMKDTGSCRMCVYPAALSSSRLPAVL